MEEPNSTRPLIDSLPNELLSAIFKAGQQSSYSSFRGGLPFPLLVSSVSRHWRDVALSYHDLWTSIHVSFAAPVEYTRLWFDRSQPCLVDLTINIRHRRHHIFYATRNDSIGGEPLRSLLKEAAGRVGQLTVVANSVIGVIDVIDILSHPNTVFARLNQLHLYARLCDKSLENSQQLIDLVAPSLRVLRLCQVRLQHLPLLPNLTYLEINHMIPEPQQFRTFMSGSPSLSHLILSGYPQRDVEPASGAIIHAPCLRFLAFDSTSHLGEKCDCILSYLSMPNLEYLEMHGDGYLAPMLTKHFQMHQPQFCRLSTLRTLSLDGFSLGTGDQSVLRTLCPMVTELHLRRTTDIHCLVESSDILGGQATSMSNQISSDGDFIWPNLNCITLPDDILPWNLLWLARAISSRQKAGFLVGTVRICHGMEQYRGVFEGLVKVNIVESDVAPRFLDSDNPDDYYDDIEESFAYVDRFRHGYDYDDDFGDYDDFYDDDGDSDDSFGMDFFVD